MIYFVIFIAITFVERQDMGVPQILPPCCRQNILIYGIYDMFKGQKTDSVLKFIEQNHCVRVYGQPNITHYFQVLDQ